MERMEDLRLLTAKNAKNAEEIKLSISWRRGTNRPALAPKIV
jgi:hypothetical protein